jgi:hypothetical protein
MMTRGGEGVRAPVMHHEVRQCGSRAGSGAVGAGVVGRRLWQGSRERKGMGPGAWAVMGWRA